MCKIEDEVGKIALNMAVKRAIETEMDDRLFDDPFAAKLAGAELPAFKKRLQKKYGTENLNQYQRKYSRFVAIRTRFFDDFLISLGQQVHQVVILGAGMDARAFRLKWPPNTHVYEIDRAQVIERKNALLVDEIPRCDRNTIAIDLKQPTQAWVEELIAEGYQATMPSVWLMEGLLMYLNAADVDNLLKTISRFTIPGSYLGADLISVESLRAGLETNDRVRKYWRFGTDEPERLFSTYGWKASVIQPGEVSASFGRNLSNKLPPREVKNVRRSFLVTASK